MSLVPYIPEPLVLQIDHVDVVASPEECWEVFRHYDGNRVPIVRALWRARGLLDFRPEYRGPEFSLDHATAEGAGWHVLEDAPPRRLIIGAVGWFWLVKPSFVDVTAESFADTNPPGAAKLAFEVRIDPRASGARITAEIRVGACDEQGAATFRRYWALIAPLSHLIRRLLLKALAQELGPATEGSLEEAFPEDGRMGARVQITDSVDIDAPPAVVWPWVQKLGAPPRPRFEVLDCEPERSLLLAHRSDLEAGEQVPFDAPIPERWWGTTWAFVLVPLAGHRTRLLVRVRLDFTPDWLQPLAASFLPPVHHFVERRQLARLKEAAEA